MDLTVVLVGPTGHGKSATGNYILGREAFISRNYSLSGTVTCDLQTSALEDGGTISVIDTPGFVHTESELLGDEVKKCITLARNRIHAILFVVSARSGEKYDTYAIRKLQKIFGENEIVQLCEGRYVRFDNETRDAVKRSIQVQNLLSQVETVISHNDGKPSLSQVFEIQLQAESTVSDATTRLERLVEAHANTINANKEHTTQRIDEVEARLRDTTSSLEQKMETAALKADERAEKYLKEETSELIQWISKSYEEQMTQRLEAAVEQRVLDMTTRLEQQLAEAHAVNKIARKQMKQRINEEVELRVKDVTTRLEQQLVEAHAAQMSVNEIAQQQMTQRINEEVESRVKDVTTRLEQQLAEAEAARVKADEGAQEAQKKSEEEILKLKEVLERAESRRSETISDFESSSFHVYDPSTYLLQSAIK